MGLASRPQHLRPRRRVSGIAETAEIQPRTNKQAKRTVPPELRLPWNNRGGCLADRQHLLPVSRACKGLR